MEPAANIETAKKHENNNTRSVRETNPGKIIEKNRKKINTEPIHRRKNEPNHPMKL
ncbi:hypothetical protein KBC86_03225 [Candidatus Gracilibacteria bacterium]|nr:hypothetical protein [Candidatus Gracilibacteria bacterium]